MGTIAVIGEAVRTAGFGLAGAIVFECETPDEVRKAWDALPNHVVSVIVTPTAAAALRSDVDRDLVPPVVVMPP
ncbi:MAG TPA: V-type ATP synthase subunit F [Acidothermaceae bacterium]|nr:V-type ATP synthase subunit F [Acidothermaceae bacterium]